MRQAGTTAAIGSFPFATRLLPLPRSAPSPILEKKKKEKKGFCYPVFLRRSGRLLTWRAGLSERPGPRLCPRPPAVPVQPPSRSSRRPRSAHARGGPAPRAATSGALVEVRFRVAALLAGRPWGLVTRAGAHERPRRRGSAGCPESGRWAGGGRRREQASISLGGLGVPPKRRRLGCPGPKPGVQCQGAGQGEGGGRGGLFGLGIWNLGSRNSPPPPLTCATLDKSLLISGSQFPCCQVGETLGPSWL